jgi:hypothetical protein
MLKFQRIPYQKNSNDEFAEFLHTYANLTDIFSNKRNFSRFFG